MKSFLLLVSGLFLTLFVFTGTSCQKETDCKAVITCNDSVGNPVSNANVQLYALVKDPNDPKGTATYTADVKASGETDGSGQVRFTFKLPAIYDVRATGRLGNKSIIGTSIVKLEEGKSVSKTVTLK